jgi:superfamily II DNA or RNA helicase
VFGVRPEILSKLRPWQHAPAEHLAGLLFSGQNAVDCSDCGVGKTYTACAVMAELQLATLAVVPKVAVSQWEAAAAHFGETISVLGYEALRTGKTPFGTWENLPPPGLRPRYFQCSNCQLRVDLDNPQPCYTHPAGIHCVVERKENWKYGRFIFHRNIQLLIFDEVQRCGAPDSLNAEMLRAARRQGIRTLSLSATLATSPLQLSALGYNLGLFKQPRDFSRWARPYGVRYDAAFHGLHWFVGEDRQLEVMHQIRRDLLPWRGVRVSTDELPDFPGVDIRAELYDVDNPEQIREMHAALGKLRERAGRYVSTELTEEMLAHQRIELLKVPLAVELAQDEMEKGFSVGIFVNFRQTIEELADRLKTNCIIDGSPEGTRNRDKSILAFQKNISRVILINVAAGGAALSLPDVDGTAPRSGLAFPGHSAEKLRQVFGRFPRANSRSRSVYRVLLAAKTGDVKIHKALRAKLNCLDALNDLDLEPDNLALT